MPVRLKKLIGTILLVTLVCVYAIVATIFAVALLANASPWIHLIYFLGTGLLWVIPAMFIISWMEKAPKKKKASIRPE
jgi:arginine exporter protein ArgO|eukprot:gene27403-biopygen23460